MLSRVYVSIYSNIILHLASTYSLLYLFWGVWLVITIFIICSYKWNIFPKSFSSYIVSKPTYILIFCDHIIGFPSIHSNSTFSYWFSWVFQIYKIILYVNNDNLAPSLPMFIIIISPICLISLSRTFQIISK